MPASFLSFLLILFWPAISFAPSDYPVLQADGAPWQFAQPRRTVVIGDVHADPDALLAILRDRGIIDGEGNWAGGDTHLVLTGDFFDRGPDSRTVLDIVMKLSKQANAARGPTDLPGQVHALMGNHELMVLRGDLRYTTMNELEGYRDFQNSPKAQEILRSNFEQFPAFRALPQRDDPKFRIAAAGMLAALSGNTPYAEFMSKRNSIIKLGDTLYVHGGVEGWAESVGPAEINATLRAWVKAAQGEGPKPALETSWVYRQSGPLWTRKLARGQVPTETLAQILKKLGVKRIVIGHTPTNSQEIESSYGNSVIREDTMISVAYGGKLSAVEISAAADGTTAVHTFQAIPRPHPHSRIPILGALCHALSFLAPRH